MALHKSTGLPQRVNNNMCFFSSMALLVLKAGTFLVGPPAASPFKSLVSHVPLFFAKMSYKSQCTKEREQSPKTVPRDPSIPSKKDTLLAIV